ncbi:hypothetical protein D3C75_963250 [compost metagenome]
MIADAVSVELVRSFRPGPNDFFIIHLHDIGQRGFIQLVLNGFFEQDRAFFFIVIGVILINAVALSVVPEAPCIQIEPHVQPHIDGS